MNFSKTSLKWALLFSSLVLGYLCYSNSLNNQPIIDDYVFEKTAPSFSSNINSSYSDYAPKFFRPVVSALTYFFSSYLNVDFVAWHGVIIFLFFLYCFLLYISCLLLTKNSLISAVAVILFSVHPINVMMAGYVTGGVTSLYGVFLQLSFICFYLWINKKNEFYRIVSLVFFLLGMLCHEVALIFPLYLIVIAYATLNASTNSNILKTIVKNVWPYLVLALCYVLYRSVYVSLWDSVVSPTVSLNYSLAAIFVTQVSLVSWYILQLFFPEKITFIWNQPLIDNPNFLLTVCLIALTSFILFLLIRYRKQNHVFVPLSIFLIGFIPVSLASFTMPTLGLIIEPHWFYFSSMGFFILVAQGIVWLFSRKFKVVYILIFCFLLSYLVFKTRAYNKIFFNQLSYSQHWLKLSPNNPSAHYYLAQAYFEEQDFTKAKTHYISSLTGGALDAQVYNNLGLIEYGNKHYEESLKYFNEAVVFNPGYATAFNNKGLVERALGQSHLAEESFITAAKLNPTLPEPSLNLIFLYWELGKKEEVRVLAENILKESHDLELLMETAAFFRDKNNFKTAFIFYSRILSLNKYYKPVYLELGKLYGNLEQFNRAIIVWQDGLKIDPADQRFKDLIMQAQALKEAKKDAEN